MGCCTLEVDRSVLSSGRSGCGGVLHAGDNRWIYGFSYKLSMIPPAIAELIAIIHMLQLCWIQGYRNIKVVTDCIEVVSLVTRGCDAMHPFKDTVDEARMMIARNWNIVFHPVLRDSNILANRLVKIAHALLGNFCIYEDPPPPLQQLVVDGVIMSPGLNCNVVC